MEYTEMKEYIEQADSIYTTIANVLTFQKLGIKQTHILGSLPEEYLEAAVGHAMVYRNSIYFYLKQYEELLGSEDNRDVWAKQAIVIETKLLLSEMQTLLDINSHLYETLNNKKYF